MLISNLKISFIHFFPLCLTDTNCFAVCVSHVYMLPFQTAVMIIDSTQMGLFNKDQFYK